MRGWIGAACLAVALAAPGTHAAHATVSTGLIGGSQFAGFLLINRGENSLQNLAFTSTLVEQGTFTQAQGNASASAQLLGLSTPQISDSRVSVSLRLRVGASASATGQAIAEGTQIYDFQLSNTSDEELVFDIRGYYGLGTSVYVSDPLTESLETFWNLRVRLDIEPIYRFGETRSTFCDETQTDSYQCRNLYDSSDDIFGWPVTIDAGESITGRLTTVVRFEVTAVPEPSPLVLLIGVGLGYLGCRRWERRPVA